MLMNSARREASLCPSTLYAHPNLGCYEYLPEYLNACSLHARTHARARSKCLHTERRDAILNVCYSFRSAARQVSQESTRSESKRPMIRPAAGGQAGSIPTRSAKMLFVNE